MSQHFNGAQKQHLDHFLLSYERWLIKTFLPWVPSWISTAHLTLMSFLWSALIVFFGWLSVKNINWLWGFSLCVFFQHISDMLDGEVGRIRNTGLVKWGFYMDHFLDYVFLCSIIIAYSFLLPPSCSLLILLCLSLTGGFMVHTLLDFGITNDFKISFHRFGAAEGRYVVVALNTALIFMGSGLMVKLIPFIALTSFVFLFMVIFQAQKRFRLIDAENLRQSHEPPPREAVIKD
jgi:phosphatidylglycerophosphate synthase